MVSASAGTEGFFEYQWKKTDLLWEYWTFVRTIQALQQLDFESTSGWIYDENRQFPQRVFIPTIPDGTTVVMERGTDSFETRTPVMLQIQDYRHRIGRLDDTEGLKHAVRTVIVLYPKDYMRAPITEEGDRVMLVQLAPGEADTHYENYLRELWG